MQKMDEDSTPVLRGSLDKCFAEQHDINNGSFEQWCFDQQQNDLKQLTVQYEDLEDKVELVECFYTQLDGNQEENRCNVEKLEKRVTELEERMERAEVAVESAVDQDALDEGDRKIDLIEERVAVLKVQNIELRNHLNLTIDMLNNVTRVLNSLFTNKEQADEATQVHEVTTSHEDINEDTQPTVQQVFDMYQSQPPDEEGWDEMTTAMEAAEEHEARKKLTVNGLTSDEWKDLLRLK